MGILWVNLPPPVPKDAIDALVKGQVENGCCTKYSCGQPDSVAGKADC